MYMLGIQSTVGKWEMTFTPVATGLHCPAMHTKAFCVCFDGLHMPGVDVIDRLTLLCSHTKNFISITEDLKVCYSTF